MPQVQQSSTTQNRVEWRCPHCAQGMFSRHDAEKRCARCSKQMHPVSAKPADKT